MNKLLIHSNNTSFNRDEFFSLSEQFVFDVDFDKDVDFYIDENLTNGDLKIKLESTDIVFIKVSLSQNYLEYLGIRLAYHIRLTKSLQEKARVPIVFIGEESVQYLGITYIEPLILFTRGVYLIKESCEEFRKVLKWYNEGKILPLRDFDGFIKSINIFPPANYQSHHSIANEWSLLRWSKVLELVAHDNLLERVKRNIESLLYYKFLQSKYPIEEEPDKAIFKIEGKGKILYIDDEWNKGWNVVLKNFFSPSDIEFETLETDFKDKSQEEIIRNCLKKLVESKPDIVLLDLRLSDIDFHLNKSKELTGYKLLRSIKEANRGMQVIIFTASNKVWNLIELQLAGADGFILKEAPELSINKSYSKDSLSSLKNQIQVSLSNSYLKEIWGLSTDIKKAFSKNPLTVKHFPKSLPDQVNGLKYQYLLLSELDALFEILNTNNENRYGHAMIMLYKIVEYLNEIFFKKVSKDEYPVFYDGGNIDFFDKNSKTWKKHMDKISQYNRSTKTTEQIKIRMDWLKSTSNKILNLTEKKLGITDSSVKTNMVSLSDYRNDFIHSDTTKRNKLTPLSSEDILIWMKSIAQIIQNI